MKIKSLEVENHPVLGTFTFDFETDKSITLLVGENGCGKTRLMEEIFKLLNEGFRLWNDEIYKSNKIKGRLNILLSKDECLSLKITTGNLLFQVDCSQLDSKGGWNTVSVFNADDKTELTSNLVPSLQSSEESGLLQFLKSKIRFSTVEINYSVPKVERAGAFEVDKEVETKSPKDLAQKITDLLVSLKTQDDARFRL